MHAEQSTGQPELREYLRGERITVLTHWSYRERINYLLRGNIDADGGKCLDRIRSQRDVLVNSRYRGTLI